MATVCKYFLKNSCKFGDRCHYSHAVPNEKYRSNPYVYDVRQKNEGVSIMQRTSPSQAANDNGNIEKLLPEYIKKVAEEVNQIEKQNMWPLTCYSFLKTQGNLSGWNDISMEEVRWEAYQARSNGTTDVYLANIQDLLSQAKEVRNLYLTPGAQVETILTEYLQSNNINTNTAGTNQNVPFIIEQPIKTQTEFSFASALEKTQPSVFNQSPTASTSSRFFTQNFNQTLFNQVPQQQQQSLPFFGVKSSFETSSQVGGHFFQNKPPQNSSISNISGGFNSSSSIFTVDHRPQMSFKSGESFINTNVNLSVYSRVEDLNKEDLEAFKANTFTLENLPFDPPPKELCQ